MEDPEVSHAELDVKHELLDSHNTSDSVESSGTELDEVPEVNSKTDVVDTSENDEKNKTKPRGCKKNIKYVDVVIEEEKGIRCPKCAAKFSSRYGLQNHLRKHNRLPVYRCALCKQQCDTNKALITHKETHEHDNLTFVCETCRLAFDNHLDWTLHKLTHQLRSLYKCEECEKYFKLKSVFQNHIETHYNKKLKCDMCSATFHTSAHLKSHKALHERSSQCKECGRIFTSASGLNYHMTTHTGVKPYQCLYCGKGFGTSLQLKVHTRVHTNERPFKCDKCSLAFKQSTDLNKHNCKAVETVKPYDCDVCNKKFKLQSSLASHMLLHSNYRPFACDQCDRKFVSYLALKFHIIYKHTTERPFVCEICSKSFKTRTGYNRHMRIHKRREERLAAK